MPLALAAGAGQRGFEGCVGGGRPGEATLRQIDYGSATIAMVR